jgi:thioredoxin 1
MATTELTEANFNEVTAGEGIVLIDFWADWCGPCKRFAPTYEKVSQNHPDIVFGKVDTEAQSAIAAEFGIQSIPTIMAVRDGVVVFRQAGALPEAMVESVIKAVQDLDMEEVRAKLTTA